MSASIQIGIDLGGSDGLPHTFLVVTNPDGSTIEYGLVPAVPESWDSTGKIGITGANGIREHEADIITAPQALTQDQYNALMNYINASILEPPPYLVTGSVGSNLGPSMNCTEWVVNAYAAAGLPTQLGITTRGTWNPYGQYIMTLVNSLFLQARSWVRRDPLTLDLNGDGLKTLAIDPNHPILFDHDGDGIKTGGSWISPQDGFLVLDRNGNGTIDSGKELFGDSTILSNGQKASDGFAALADLDSNHDGVFNASDAQFANVRVWVDANSNAVSEASELRSLSQLNIQAISLTKTATNQTLPDGSRVVDTGTFTYTNGTVGTDGVAGDVDLREAA